MGGMDFENLEPRIQRMSSGCGKTILNGAYFCDGEFTGHDPSFADRFRAGGHNVPGHLTTSRVAVIHRSIAVPGALHARLATRMRNLNRWQSTISGN